MSFLSRSQPFLRSALVRPSPRLFSTAVIYQKSATDTVKDGLKAVDRTVSDVAVKGIDKGVELKDAAAEITGTETGKAKGTAQEVAGQAKGKAEELSGQAKGKAEELKGQAKGKAEEVKAKM